MKVHIFGAVSSPSCANFALQKTAQDNQHNYSKEAVDTIQHNFYVGDCLKSVFSKIQAISLFKELSEICSKGGFKLTKWTSNSKSVLLSMPVDDRRELVKDLDLDKKVHKLKVHWVSVKYRE